MKLNNLQGLFGRKKYIKNLENTNEILKQQLECANQAHKLKCDELFNYMDRVSKLEKKISSLETKYDRAVEIANDYKKSYEEQENEFGLLKYEYEELKKKYAESMTDKYLVRKIPEGKTPQQKIRSNARGTNSQNRKRLEETSELRGLL